MRSYLSDTCTSDRLISQEVSYPGPLLSVSSCYVTLCSRKDAVSVETLQIDR